MKSFLKLSVFLFLLTITLSAQNSAQDVLESLQNKYKSLNDFSVDFKQSVDNKVNIAGRLIYAKENKLRVELNKSTIISDGKSIWNYNKSKNQVVINNTDAATSSYFTIDKFLYDYPSKSSIYIQQDNGKNVLVLTPKQNSGVDFKTAKIWINSDNLVSKVSIENLSGKETEIDLRNYSVNKNISDSKFSFSPPEGTKIIDLRK